MSKNKTLAIVAAVAAFAAVSASAAGLGTLTGQSIGAETSVVAGCDTDGISVAYTTAYVAAAKEYQVSAVVLSGINVAGANNCLTKPASVTVAGTAGASLGAVTANVATASQTFTLPAPVSAAAVLNVAVVIAG